MRVSKVNIITNDKNLIDANDPNNKDVLKQMQQDKEQQYNNYNYAIDLNTGEVKNNTMLTFFLDTLHNIPSHNIKNDTTQEMYNYYISDMQKYLETIKEYKNKKYKTINALNKDIIKFNKMFDANYYNGFNLRVKDLLNDVIKNDYIIARATATATIQRENIKNIGIDNFIKLDLDDAFIKYDNTDATKNVINFYVSLLDMKQLQQEFKNHIDKNDFYNDLVIHKFIFEITIRQTTENIQNEINNYKEQYKQIHTLYTDINKCIREIVENFKNVAIKLNEYDNLPQAKQPNKKEVSLYAPKIFNNTYILDKYTSIDKNNNGRYDIKINISYLTDNNDIIDDLNDVIFIDEINKKQLSLIPLDLALFMGFTSINSLNGGNIPITLTDAIKQISEDKTARIRPNQKDRKTPKAYQFYTDRLLMFDRFKVKAIILDKEQKNKKVMEFIDPIGIMENKRVYLNNRGDYGYIIGSSAILTILNYLSKISDTPYLATFLNDNQYINDGQKDTLAILNIKYYVLFKILQRHNRADKGQYNPKIDLTELYKQTALLKGTSDLTRVEKQRVREQLTQYLEHLKSIDKPLLQWYGYEPYKAYLTHKETQEQTKPNNKAITDIYIKIKEDN